MRKLAVGIVGLLLSVLAISIVMANVGNNDKNGWQVNGPHYNLNIIGVDKHGTVGDSNGNTMFVKLDGHTKIEMTQDGGGFLVTDRNGLDGEASFNIAPGHYNVYARGLGKPGGKVNISAYGLFDDAQTGDTLIWLGEVDISRETGKPQTVNINKLFYVDVTLCTAYDEVNNVCTETTTYTNYWVFDIDELLQYYWDYNNEGLKLLQVRFYGCTLDPTGTASDYCQWGDGTPIDSQKTVLS